MRWLVAILMFVVVACNSAKQKIYEANKDDIVNFFEDVLSDGKHVVFDEVIEYIYVYNEHGLLPISVKMPNDSIAENDEDFLMALDTVFSNKDRKYMLKQIENMPAKWDESFFPKRVILDTSDYLESWRKYTRGGVGDSVITAKWIKERDSFKVRYNMDNYKNLDNPYPVTNSTYTLSFPIFNKEKSKAIIRVSNSCGTLCGEWGIILYYKIDGHWKRINHFQYSVS